MPGLRITDFSCTPATLLEQPACFWFSRSKAPRSIQEYLYHLTQQPQELINQKLPSVMKRGVQTAQQPSSNWSGTCSWEGVWPPVISVLQVRSCSPGLCIWPNRSNFSSFEISLGGTGFSDVQSGRVGIWERDPQSEEQSGPDWPTPFHTLGDLDLSVTNSTV